MEKEKDITDFLNKIILGDCIEVMKQMPNGKVDLIFADPPLAVSEPILIKSSFDIVRLANNDF